MPLLLLRLSILIVGIGVIGIGLVHSLVLTAIIYAIAYRSGAQVNPAVTIGLLAARKIGGKEAALYIICQLVGAIIGAAVVYAMFGSTMSTSVTLPSENNIMRAFILETVNDIYISVCSHGYRYC